MVPLVLQSFLREYCARPMARFTFWVLAYGAALWVVRRISGPVPGLLWFIFWISGVVAAVYYASRLIGYVKHRLLWRLRRRLIATYVFIAVVPILLIVTLVALGAFVFSGQLAAFLVAQRIQHRFDGLQQLNRAVIHTAHLAAKPTPEALLDGLETFYLHELSDHAGSYPGLEITMRLGPVTRAFRLVGGPLSKAVTIPVWLQSEEFAGIVEDQGQVLLRAAVQGNTAAGKLTVILTQPVTPELLDLVGERIGPVGVTTTEKEKAPTSSGAAPSPGRLVETREGAYVPSGVIRSRAVPLPAPASSLDFTVLGASTLGPTFWGGEEKRELREPVFVYVTSRIVTLNRQLLATLGRYSGGYWVMFEVVAIILLVIEFFALIIGIRLTRSITDTVDKLHDATVRVKVGDFSYRINLPARDQLTALGEAFDSMTASVERLLRESQEKSRLESELEIAREVQRQLFPKAAPEVPGLRLHGTCQPARAVSGDYYDFLHLGSNRVNLVLGDVSGKGISAALLMAAMQSALRAHLI